MMWGTGLDLSARSESSQKSIILVLLDLFLSQSTATGLSSLSFLGSNLFKMLG